MDRVRMVGYSYIGSQTALWETLTQKFEAGQIYSSAAVERLSGTRTFGHVTQKGPGLANSTALRPVS
jgi:hypothetical protein